MSDKKLTSEMAAHRVGMSAGLTIADTLSGKFDEATIKEFLEVHGRAIGEGYADRQHEIELEEERKAVAAQKQARRRGQVRAGIGVVAVGALAGWFALTSDDVPGAEFTDQAPASVDVPANDNP